jgi:hypothetical protein
MFRKTITYATPGSRYARRFKMTAAGCYLVVLSRHEPFGSPLSRPLAAFPTLAEARTYAETLAYPWDETNR